MLNFPTVYIHNWKETNDYEVYIGESNNIIQRTKQHYDMCLDKSKWQHKLLSQNASLYIIGHKTRRGYGEFKGGWEFPSGKIEEGETSRGALEREIKEELAVEINVNELVDTIEYDYPTFHLSMYKK